MPHNMRNSMCSGNYMPADRGRTEVTHLSDCIRVIMVIEEQHAQMSFYLGQHTPRRLRHMSTSRGEHSAQRWLTHLHIVRLHAVIIQNVNVAVKLAGIIWVAHAPCNDRIWYMLKNLISV